MKKLSFLFVMVLLLTTLAGCKKGNVTIKTSEIEQNTMLVKSDGTIQVATVEEFNQDYYDMNELESFIHDNITEFNQKVGNDKAIVLDSLDKKKGKAIMVLEYANMEFYAQFNEVEAALLDEVTSDTVNSFATTFVQAGKEEDADSSELESLKNAKAIVLNEEYDLLLGEKIRYYSKNSTYVDDHKVHTSPDGTSVIIYIGDSKK